MAKDFSLILFAQEKAVSVAEKNPEKKIKTIIEISKGMDPSGIIVLQIEIWKYTFPIIKYNQFEGLCHHKND